VILKDIVNSKPIKTVDRLQNLFIILGWRSKKNRKKQFIVLVPVADPSKLKDSVFLIQTSSRYENGKACNIHKSLANSTKIRNGMSIGKGNRLTFFDHFVAESHNSVDFSKRNSSPALIKTQLDLCWSKYWGRETATIFKEERKCAAYPIQVPKAFYDAFSVGGTSVSAKLLSRSGVVDYKKTLTIIHNQLQKESDLPPRITPRFDKNMVQEALLCQG
jgi:hypothetical protein